MTGNNNSSIHVRTNFREENLLESECQYLRWSQSRTERKLGKDIWISSGNWENCWTQRWHLYHSEALGKILEKLVNFGLVG